MNRAIISGRRAFMAAAVAATFLACRSGGQGAQHYDSQVGEVLGSGVIRAGYVVYPPGLMKDPNTGRVSGIFVDMVERAASALSLRVEWTEEVGWGTMIEGLRSKRYDIIGSPVWANATRAREADFSIPLFYSGIGVYTRSNDHRFDRSLSAINDPSVKIAAIDGEMSSLLASSQYPRATVVGSPQLTDNSRILLDVASGKADVTFVEPYIAELFLEQSPGSLRNIVPQRPLRVFPNTIMFRQGEPSFRAMMNTALQEQINMGAIAELFAKYRVSMDAFYQVAAPYSAR